MATEAAKSTTHSPTLVAKVPPYLAINPGLFDSADHWSYRDLQKLAKRLDLPCTGQRESLVERLKAWHREQRTTGQAGLFHTVQVRATPEGKAISPRLLSPLQPSSQSARAARGILSSNNKHSPRRSDSACAPPSSPAPLQRNPSQLENAPPQSPKGNVLFSPYNMVKLIPSKEHSEMYRQYREPCHFLDDDDD